MWIKTDLPQNLVAVEGGRETGHRNLVGSNLLEEFHLRRTLLVQYQQSMAHDLTTRPQAETKPCLTSFSSQTETDKKSIGARVVSRFF